MSRRLAPGWPVGPVAALGLTRFLQSLLYGIRANDPLLLVGAIGFLALVTSIACLAPALRAMRVEPIAALRCD